MCTMELTPLPDNASFEYWLYGLYNCREHYQLVRTIFQLSERLPYEATRSLQKFLDALGAILRLLSLQDINMLSQLQKLTLIQTGLF